MKDNEKACLLDLLRSELATCRGYPRGFIIESLIRQFNRKVTEKTIIIERTEKHTSEMIAEFGDEFGRYEYESPTVYVDTDKVFRVKIVTPDAEVVIRRMSGDNAKKHKTWVIVSSNLFPDKEAERESRDRMHLIGFDPQREGATISVFGAVRLRKNLFPEDD